MEFILNGINWLDSHSGSVQAIATVILVVITGIYAWRTHVISKATSKQADASVRMAQEMKETRELAYRPELALWRVPVRIDDSEQYGHELNSITLKIENVGSGPTMDITVEAWWNNTYYKYDAVSALRGGEIRDYVCSQSMPAPPVPLVVKTPRDFVVRLKWQDLNKRPFKREQTVTQDEMELGGTIYIDSNGNQRLFEREAP